jgi:hypothetical protein
MVQCDVDCMVILVVDTFSYAFHLVCAVATLLVIYRYTRRLQIEGTFTQRHKHAILTSSFLFLGTINYGSSLGSQTAMYSFNGVPMPPLWQEVPSFMISILAQGYLVHRCYVLVGQSLFLISGFLVYMAVLTGFGVANLVFNGEDDGWPTTSSFTFLGDPDVRFLPMTYWLLSLFFNVCVNILIIWRLLWMRTRMTSALGSEYGKMYTGIASMMLESSMLYSLVLAVSYKTLPGQGGTANLFSPLVSQTECIASELIILRLALGRSLSKSAVHAVTSKTDGGHHSPHSVAPPMGRPPGSEFETRVTQIYPSSVAAVLRSYDKSESV